MSLDSDFSVPRHGLLVSLGNISPMFIQITDAEHSRGVVSLDTLRYHSKARV